MRNGSIWSDEVFENLISRPHILNLRSRNQASESPQLRVTRVFFSLLNISQLRRPSGSNFHMFVSFMHMWRNIKWEDWSLTITKSVGLWQFPIVSSVFKCLSIWKLNIFFICWAFWTVCISYGCSHVGSVVSAPVFPPLWTLFRSPDWGHQEEMWIGLFQSLPECVGFPYQGFPPTSQNFLHFLHFLIYNNLVWCFNFGWLVDFIIQIQIWKRS